MEQKPIKVGASGAWGARSRRGPKPKFAQPDDLWDAATEYFEWVEDNPLITAEAVKHQGTGTLMAVPKMRAMTLRGLCNFLDIDRTTWQRYTEIEEFMSVTMRIEDVILQQKIEGAAAGLLTPSFIGQEIGLVQRTESDVSLEGRMEVEHAVIEFPAKSALPESDDGA